MLPKLRDKVLQIGVAKMGSLDQLIKDSKEHGYKVCKMEPVLACMDNGWEYFVPALFLENKNDSNLESLVIVELRPQKDEGLGYKNLGNVYVLAIYRELSGGEAFDKRRDNWLELKEEYAKFLL